MVDGDGDGQITKAEFLLAFKVSGTAKATATATDSVSTADAATAATTASCSIGSTGHSSAETLERLVPLLGTDTAIVSTQVVLPTARLTQPLQLLQRQLVLMMPAVMDKRGSVGRRTCGTAQQYTTCSTSASKLNEAVALPACCCCNNYYYCTSLTPSASEKRPSGDRKRSMSIGGASATGLHAAAAAAAVLTPLLLPYRHHCNHFLLACVTVAQQPTAAAHAAGKGNGSSAASIIENGESSSRSSCDTEEQQGRLMHDVSTLYTAQHSTLHVCICVVLARAKLAVASCQAGLRAAAVVCMTLHATTDSAAMGWQEGVIQSIANFMYQNRHQLAGAFRSFDLNNDGEISSEEFSSDCTCSRAVFDSKHCVHFSRLAAY
eukprot:20100-Heterococcus_DN1.PRE.2